MKIIESRPVDDNSRRRRYECFNLHRFGTLECIKKEGTKPSEANLATAHKERSNSKANK